MIKNNNNIDTYVADEYAEIDVSRVIEHFAGQYAADTATKLYALRRCSENGSNFTDIINSLERSNGRLLGFINAMAELFGKDKILSRPRISSYNVIKYINDIAAQINSAISIRGEGEVVFKTQKSDVCSASFDVRRVSTILYHLISNSLQHGKTEDKTVIIKCKKEDGLFEISVSDHGGGIPKAVQSTMYTKFLEEYSFKNQMLGNFPPRVTGLGLLLCRKLSADMNGEIKFRNISGGAQFTLVIPQTKTSVKEESVYVPDDALMNQCMAYLDIEDIGGNND